MSLDYSDNFFFTEAGYIIPTVTGSISFLCSLSILTYILRSKKNTVYHRILFLLSLFDMLTSAAIAVTTLPMPKDVVQVYEFKGPSYGTTTTCAIQSMLFIIGNGMILAMNSLLNLYYLCTLKFNMAEGTFVRYVEIPIYAISIITIVPCTFLLALRKDLLNPFSNDILCVVAIYPLDCDLEDDPVANCRGTQGDYKNFMSLFHVLWASAFGVLFVTMILIILSVRKQYVDLLKARGSRVDEDLNDEIMLAFERSRTVTRQALMYLGSFIITWLFLFIDIIDGIKATVQWIQVCRVIFQPLQGLFNMLIFFYHKIHTSLRANEDQTFFKALSQIVKDPKNVPEVIAISNIDSITLYDTMNKLRNAWNQEKFSRSKIEIDGAKQDDSSKVVADVGLSTPKSIRSESFPDDDLSYSASKSGGLSGFSFLFSFGQSVGLSARHSAGLSGGPSEGNETASRSFN